MKFKMSILIILFLSCAVGAQAQSRSIYGAYQDCPFHCRTIRINPDLTFEYRLNGDLYNNLRIRGTWRFIDRNRIRAVSPQDQSAPAATERVTNREDSFIVIVQDFTGALISGAEVSGIADSSAFKVRTNSEGSAEIPKCQQFEVRFNGYGGTHVIENPQTDEFVITLTVEQMSRMAVDEVWLIEENRLYIADSVGTFDRDYWLRRLSRREERRVFR